MQVDNIKDEIIESISYDNINDLYYILTGKRLICLDMKDGINIKEREFKNEIYDINDAIVLYQLEGNIGTHKDCCPE
ncbi:hypothetical protein [Herbinix luporum]|uniref:hypothetical protein n=1 Tax=Herbinix luporum TaxID=1679721 RepID=UPI0023F07A5A|nr:hypothetical protein [Herbinix luporum]